MNEFTAHWDSNTGLDSVCLELFGHELKCFALNSPLDESVKKLFGYTPEVYSEKSFKANWTIRDNELQVIFANGIIHGEIQNTHDLIPEQPSDAVFYNYLFTGNLLLEIKQAFTPDIVFEALNADKKLELVFEKGILTGWIDRDSSYHTIDE